MDEQQSTLPATEPVSLPHPQSRQHRPHHRPRLPIRTYHCRFCSHLLVATTRDILSDALRRRREPSLDRAIILPLPSRRAIRENAATAEEEESESESESETDQEYGHEHQQDGDIEGQQQQQAPTTSTTTTTTTSITPRDQQHYTILLSTTIPDRKITIIRREDGFEKRILLRCGRCRVVMGYLIDDADQKRRKSKRKIGQEDKHKDDSDSDNYEDDEEADDDEDEDDDDDDRVAYILPGALVGTEDLGVDEDSSSGAGRTTGVDIPIEKNPVLQAFEREWTEWIKST